MLGRSKHTKKNDMMTLLRKSWIAVLALAPVGWATVAMASPPDRAGSPQADQVHPAYLRALSDLRNARANLARRADDAQMRWDEHRAIETIEQAINEIKAAAITDGKDLEDHPPVDEREARSGRLHKALAALRAAREDVSKEEDNAFAKGLRARSIRYIDDAIGFTQEGIGELEHVVPSHAPGGSNLNDGLVSWWRGEDNAGDSAGPNSGNIQGGLTFVPGRVGQAFKLNGKDADVLIASSPTLNLAQGCTFALWVRFHVLPTLPAFLVDKWVWGGEDKFLSLNKSGIVGFKIFPVHGNNPVLSVTLLTPDMWHHIAATYDGANEAIYIDGHLDASVVASGTIRNSTAALSFGHTSAGRADPTFFAGDLDEIRWYSRALSAAEVAALASGAN
jgi:hypothetical protein